MSRLAVLLAVLACCLSGAGHAATPSVAAGGFHSLALHRDGTVRSWGDDSTGALGIGRVLFSPNPLPVSGLSGVTAVSAGVDYALALRNDGSVWAWGYNEYGKLGDGSTTSRSIPVRVEGLTGVMQIAAGRTHAVARTADGGVWTWGYNGVGQLGTDQVGERSIPARVGGLPPAAEVAAGMSHTIVRTVDGSVWTFGQNDVGQLGDGNPTEPYRGRFTPVRVTSMSDVTQVSAGAFHTVVRRGDGSVWAWGGNAQGQAGDGTTTMRSSPVQVQGLAGVVEISAGAEHSLARKSDGTVWAWGDGGYGQLGDDMYQSRLIPIRLEGLTGVSQLAAGFLHSVAVKADGGLVVWGANGHGQLGDGTTNRQGVPTQVANINGVAAGAVGAYFTVVLKRDGTVLTFGDNSRGQLGNGVFSFRAVPSAIAGLSGVVAISAAYDHSFALTSDGRVFGWGTNNANQFADNSVGRAEPFRVPGLSNVSALSAGFFHTIALLTDGTVRAFGSSYRGRLGLGNQDGVAQPTIVPGLTGVRQVSSGGGHTLALKTDGTVWSWGENGNGQLGDGTTADRFSPILVAGLGDVVEVSAGADHSLARRADGSVWAWGGNSTGQVNGGSTDQLRPVRVTGLPSGPSAIIASRGFSLAIVGGAVWAWGINYSGGLGCPGCDGSRAPIQVPGLSRIAAVASKQGHVLALRDDGSILAWGAGQFGQVGDGTLVDRESPVVVLHEGATGSVATNDWYLDLDPTVASTIAAEQVPVFLVATRPAGADIAADMRFRAEDVGTPKSLFVFALAPATRVQGGQSAAALKMGKARGAAAKADAPIACVLAQLNASGQMVAVTSSNLAAYLTGVLSAQGASVSILNGVPTGNVAGATFFVGYGGSGTAMINTGTNRAAVTVPGSLTCQPSAPQTGWWWNPLEDGRGFSIEKRGNNLFFAAFLYDISGRSNWYVSSGPVSLDGSLYNGDLLGASGGQTLGGPYTRFPTLASAGAMTMTFNNESTGTIVWPGGTVPIQRFNIVPNGLTAPPVAGTPESGWWWNEQEAGRGFFMEWQNGTLDIAGYMYDDAGNPVWYLTVGGTSTTNPQNFTGTWWSYGGGQTLTGPWRQNSRTDSNVAPLSITFSAPDTALMTLPNGRTTSLKRHRF